MKLLVWGVILSLNLSFVNASAAAGYSDDGDSRFSGLAVSICGSYTTAGANFKSEFNETMKRHMGHFENNPNPTPKQITDYLNKDKMTCGTGEE